MSVTLTTRGANGGGGQSAFTAAAWTPTAGNIVLAISDCNDASALTVPTPWGTWQTLLDRNGGSHVADANGNYWTVMGVVVGASPTSAAPSVGVPGGASGESQWIEISGLDSSNLASLLVQFNNAAKTSTSGDKTMATTLATFASPGNLCLALKYGFGSQPWAAVTPLGILAQYNTGTYNNVASAYYVGQDLSPEIDGSNAGVGMGILAVELKVPSVVVSQAMSSVTGSSLATRF